MLIALKYCYIKVNFLQNTPDSKVHGANMGHTWVLSAPDGPHEPTAIRDIYPQ